MWGVNRACGICRVVSRTGSESILDVLGGCSLNFQIWTSLDCRLISVENENGGSRSYPCLKSCATVIDSVVGQISSNYRTLAIGWPFCVVTMAWAPVLVGGRPLLWCE